jgi:hypothetical protein
MNWRLAIRKPILAVIVASNLSFGVCAFAADIKGQVLGGGAPIAKSTVTLWEASAGAPKQLDQTKTSGDGRFQVRTKGAHGDAILYLIDSGGEPKANKGGGDNPGIVLLSVLGNQPPESVVVNELTTVASVRLSYRISFTSPTISPSRCVSQAGGTTPLGGLSSMRRVISGAARTGCPARSPASTRARAAV